MTKLRLLLEESSGEKVPVTDEALTIIFNSLSENTLQEMGVKMMVSVCLNGLEHPDTQRLGIHIRDNS
jgi:hypothetical protein